MKELIKRKGIKKYRIQKEGKPTFNTCISIVLQD